MRTINSGSFRGVQSPLEAGSCASGPANRPAVGLMQQWALFWFCVGLDALVLYALMSYAEHYAR